MEKIIRLLKYSILIDNQNVILARLFIRVRLILTDSVAVRWWLHWGMKAHCDIIVAVARDICRIARNIAEKEEERRTNFTRREREEWIRYATWRDCCTNRRRSCDIATRLSKRSGRNLRSVTSWSVTFKRRFMNSGRSSIWACRPIPSVLIRDRNGKPYRRNHSEATRNRWRSLPRRKGRSLCLGCRMAFLLYLNVTSYQYFLIEQFCMPLMTFILVYQLTKLYPI